MVNDKHMRKLDNGSLLVTGVLPSDADNYTCRAENQNGADQINVALVVQGEHEMNSGGVGLH